MEEDIVGLIEMRGPLTGAEIHQSIGGDGLLLWQTCKRSTCLVTRSVGTRYLRLDRRVESLARLSPSVWREFLTYSVIGLAGGEAAADARAGELLEHVETVSRAKLELVYRIASGLGMWLDAEYLSTYRYCFIIAGDIVYNMAHDVPRKERSTGKYVAGSDMDLVVIVDNDCPMEVRKRIDEAIYLEKCRLLMTPHLREEIDYVVKDLQKVQEQTLFNDFKPIVACKILHEGTLLYGDEGLFQSVKSLLRSRGVVQKLEDLDRRARVFRREAEAFLLENDPETVRRGNLHFFYPTEESEEFE